MTNITRLLIILAALLIAALAASTARAGRLPSAGEKQALRGTGSRPGRGNPYVLLSDLSRLAVGFTGDLAGSTLTDSSREDILVGKPLSVSGNVSSSGGIYANSIGVYSGSLLTMPTYSGRNVSNMLVFEPNATGLRGNPVSSLTDDTGLLGIFFDVNEWAGIIHTRNGLWLNGSDNSINYEGKLRTLKGVSTNTSTPIDLASQDNGQGKIDLVGVFGYHDKAHRFRVDVTAYGTAGANEGMAAAFTLEFLAKNVGGTVSIVGDPLYTILADESGGAWSCGIGSISSTTVNVTFAGDAASTIQVGALVGEAIAQ